MLTISLHQDGLYPAESGLVEHTGEGAGEGSNLNVPLPAGSGDGGYVAAFERVVVPAIETSSPSSSSSPPASTPDDGPAGG